MAKKKNNAVSLCFHLLVTRSPSQLITTTYQQQKTFLLKICDIILSNLTSTSVPKNCAYFSTATCVCVVSTLNFQIINFQVVPPTLENVWKKVFIIKKIFIYIHTYLLDLDDKMLSNAVDKSPRITFYVVLLLNY